MDPALKSLLADGAKAIGVDLDAAQRDRLLDYVALLLRWNAAYNLTAVREPRAIVVRHLLDSLAVLPHLEGKTFADLGSGAGLPGIPLAVADPGRRFVLVEANGKKARFLREARRALGLANVEVVEARAEGASAAGGCDAAIARAVATVGELVPLAQPWVPPGGRLYAMKGPGHAAELAQIPDGWRLATILTLDVPGLDEHRALVVLARDP